MRFCFNEMKGRTQGRIFIINADTVEDAIDKFSADMVVKPYDNIRMWANVYEVYEDGKPWKVLYRVHKEV